MSDWSNLSHPLDGITPKPTKEEADELMSNLPITNKKRKSMGKTRSKKHKSKKMPKGYKQGGLLGSQGY